MFYLFWFTHAGRLLVPPLLTLSFRPASTRLSQVELALSADPSNAELQSLQAELTELIELSKAALAASQPAAGPSKPSKPTAVKATTDDASPKRTPPTASASSSSAITAPAAPAWKVGDEILALYMADKQYYRAKIISVSGPPSAPLYTCVYSQYSDSPPVMLPPASIRSLPASKRKPTAEEEREERLQDKKKAKNEKWKEVKKSKNEEQIAKQDSWKKFGAKAAKKGTTIAGLQGKSIFRSPDNPLGKGESRPSFPRGASLALTST